MTMIKRAHERDREIDMLVDRLLEDPKRADEVKLILRRKIESDDNVRPFRGDQANASSAPSGEVEGEDLWDNVPI